MKQRQIDRSNIDILINRDRLRQLDIDKDSKSNRQRQIDRAIYVEQIEKYRQVENMYKYIDRYRFKQLEIDREIQIGRNIEIDIDLNSLKWIERYRFYKIDRYIELGWL